MREVRGWMLLVSVSLAACGPVFTQADFGEPLGFREETRMVAEAYGRTARRVAALPESSRARERAARHGIEVVDALAEVAARSRSGAADPRDVIAGLELRVPGEDRSPAAVLAPVFRSSSAPLLDVRLDRFYLRVGNHHGEQLRTVTLGHFLSDVGRYVTSPASLTGAGALGERVSLLSPRDSHVLVEVRTAVIPISLRGRAALRPVVWSSAPAPRVPAALTLTATPEGTSVRVIDNRAEDRALVGSGQVLDFNDGGERRAFGIARRRLEALVVIEIPLLTGQLAVRADVPRAKDSPPSPEPARPAASAPAAAPPAIVRSGPFVEGSGDHIERDESRPLRATVFLLYPVLDGDLDDADWESIASRLRAVSMRADLAATLLLPETDARRAL